MQTLKDSDPDLCKIQFKINYNTSEKLLASLQQTNLKESTSILKDVKIQKQNTNKLLEKKYFFNNKEFSIFNNIKKLTLHTEYKKLLQTLNSLSLIHMQNSNLNDQLTFSGEYLRSNLYTNQYRYNCYNVEQQSRLNLSREYQQPQKDTKRKQGIFGQHFLFNKINNKSFIGYWLIPIASFAFITPYVLYNFGTNFNYNGNKLIHLITKNTLHNTTDVKNLSSNHVLLLSSYQRALDGRDPLVGMEYLLSNLAKSQLHSNLTDIQTLSGHDFFGRSLQLASLVHNTQYSLINNTNKSINYKHDKAQNKINAKKKPTNISNFMFYTSYLTSFSDPRKGIAEKDVFIQNYNLDYVTHFPFFQSLVNNKFYNNLNVTPLKSLFYLSTIRPLHSKIFVNNNVNFITTENSLKLLKLKLLKLHKLKQNRQKEKLSTNIANSMLPSLNLLSQKKSVFKNLQTKFNLINFKYVDRASKLKMDTPKNKFLLVPLQNVFCRISCEMPNQIYLDKSQNKPIEQYKEGLYLNNLNGAFFKEFDNTNKILNKYTKIKNKGASLLAPYNIIYKQEKIAPTGIDPRSPWRCSIPFGDEFTSKKGAYFSSRFDNFNTKNKVLLNYFLFNSDGLFYVQPTQQTPREARNLTQFTWLSFASKNKNEEIQIKNEQLTFQKSNFAAQNQFCKASQFEMLDRVSRQFVQYSIDQKDPEKSNFDYGKIKKEFLFLKLKSNLINSLCSFKSSYLPKQINIINKQKKQKLKNNINILKPKNVDKDFQKETYSISLRSIHQKTNFFHTLNQNKNKIVKKSKTNIFISLRSIFHSYQETKVVNKNLPLSILLKHKKMFKNKTEAVTVRLHLQKKRKAKKQRLETRRQKKRTRFFPRPIWLRYRMFFNFIKQRKLAMARSIFKNTHNKNIVYNIKNLQIFSRNEQAKQVDKGASEFKFKKLSLNFQKKGDRFTHYYKLNNFILNQDKFKYTIKLFCKLQKLQNYYLLCSSSQTITKQIKNNQKNKLSRFARSLEMLNQQKKKLKYSISLRDIKIKANYIDFKNQKTNNPPSVNEKDKDTMFKNFWIWVYNNTLTNFAPLNHQNLWWLLPNNANSDIMVNSINIANKQKIKKRYNYTKQTKNAFAITRIYWALNKTNTNSFTNYNKRYNLWGTQKLRNQSKNNKTKLLEKQLLTNWERFFLNQKLNLFYKKIITKSFQKTQKLNYLTTYKNISFARSKNILKTKNLAIFNTSWWSNLNSKIILNKIELVNKEKGALNLPFISKIYNPQVTTTADNFIYKQLNNTFDTVYLQLFETKQINTICMESVKFHASTLLISSSVLLHLCALISLISISQVRCFLKFHLILLYKLSNVYNLLIPSLKMNSFFNILKYKNNFMNKEKNSNRAIKTYNFIKSIYTQPKNEKVNKNSKKVLAFLQQQKQNKLLTIFSINLLQKEFNITEQKTSHNFVKQSIYSKLNIISIKALGLKQVLIKLNKKRLIQNEQSKVLYLNLKNQILQISNFRTGIAPASPWRGRMEEKNKPFQKSTLNKTNYVLSPEGGSNSLSLGIPQRGLSLRDKKFKIHNTKLNVVYKSQQLKLYAKKSINNLFKASKKMVSFVILNLIDLFQTSIRILTNFFEKPTEFTTTWIAYGFLVEWSADFITIIPENVDIYIWSSFSKIARIMPSTLILNFNGLSESKNILFFVKDILQYPYQSLLFSNKKTEIVNLIPFGSIGGFATLLTISHLLHRRMLHLFDILIETISQPDTDLLSRQQKGTLFWDIWADFLVTAADLYNVNVAALSTIKAEQNALIENISNDFGKNNFISKQTRIKKVSNLQFLSTKFNLTMQIFLFNNKLLSLKNVDITFKKSQLQKSNNSIKKQLLLKTYLQSTIQNKNFADIYIQNYNFEEKFLSEGLNVNFFSSANSPFKRNKKQESLLANLNRWSVNQYITYQSWHSHNGSNNSNGDLFIDYHPPKSFSHLPVIKYLTKLQQPIGNLVCQIYSGIFNKQIAKNLLLVTTKTKQNLTDYNLLLIQALAGETELKIITDNAQRYALVNRGFAIGIKLLRDVFDAIALNTPCIFLLEDIHTIGERRPMLISDSGGALSDDNASFKEDFFGSQRDEVHEKNQIVYQLTRHAITHYKKPFKGDYSLAIPTNLYLSDLFLKQSTLSTSNYSLMGDHNLTIKNKILSKQLTKNQHSNESIGRNLKSTSISQTGSKLLIRGKKMNKSQIAPPKTSPFSILLLKEEKKLKPNKSVEELPWTGLPGEQLSIKPRTSYSVRAKVAMLAEFSLSNVSAKLDMITDLLVIIDSVRSNKGFVVFATTDVPHVLDPALRRPGRLDETICLPNISNSIVLNFKTNYEILKSVKLLHNPLTSISDQLNKLLTNNHKQYLDGFSTKTLKNKFYILDNIQSSQLLFSVKNLSVNLKDYNTVLGTAIKQTNINQNKKTQYAENSRLNYALISYSKKLHLASQISNFNSGIDPASPWRYSIDQTKSKNSFNWKIKNQISTSVNTLQRRNKEKAVAYYEVGKILLNYYLNNQNNINKMIFFGDTYFANLAGENINFKTINYLSLFGSKNKLILQLMLIFGGKISQLLSSKNSRTKNLNTDQDSGREIKISQPLHKQNLNNLKTANILDLDMSQIFESNINFATSNPNFKIATEIMLAFIHKRYLYRKNLIVPKLLSFTDGNVLEEPPCPPFSSLLIPAKRFENYKRVFHDSLVGDKMGERKAQISFAEKLQYHMQLRSIKLLNNAFNETKHFSSQSQSFEKIFTKPLQDGSPYNLVKKIAPFGALPANNLLQTTTNINWYYQNRILKRHGQYLTNQWWNGQLSEHNAESVFLSDIDWRSCFIKNKQIRVIKIKNKYSFSKSLLLSTQKKSSDSLDVLLDFPDTDQYYNPRRRRWLLNKGYWSFWFNFDKVYSEEIIYMWILESIIQTYTYLYNNTELLDFMCSKFIGLGYPNIHFFEFSSSNNNLAAYSKTELSTLKEIILTNSFKRF
uniref:Cell division protein n=1 Tax=Gonium pectorale TaxID=33097 RepID=M1VMD7_GONPE|nr:cell division protein [Gonium pectorale]BAM85957.1 cell division protein [Gonium pectorale]